jgi:Ca2+-binding EF-hand superfamily protein
LIDSFAITQTSARLPGEALQVHRCAYAQPHDLECRPLSLWNQEARGFSRPLTLVWNHVLRRNQTSHSSTVGKSQREPRIGIVMKTETKRTSIVAACCLAWCILPAAFAGPDSDKHFKMMDTNGDGKVSRAEHASAAKEMFAQCDANRDGVVTAAEMDAATAAKGEKPGKDDKTSAEKIQVIDQNGDGQLTTAEHEAGTEKMFAQMDKNGDGSLSKAECDEGMKMMKKHK